MAPIVDSQFWNQETESSRAVHGEVHTLPFEPPPLGLLRSNCLIRSQQLLLLQEYCSFPVTPSFSDGAFSLDSVVSVAGGLNWWSTITARLQTHGLVDLLREGIEGNCSLSTTSDGWKRIKQLYSHSMNALGLLTTVHISPITSVRASCEVDDGLARLLSCNYLDGKSDKPWHALASITHKMKRHDFLLDAAWNDKCVDRRGKYWNVPETVSLDVQSHASSTGLRYRAGVHGSSGVSTEVSGEPAEPLPFGALAGICGRAALFWEKEKDLWIDRRTKPNAPFKILASNPRATFSCLFGGILTVDSLKAGLRQENFILKDVNPRLSADAFASVGLSTQLGRFRRWFLDYSRVDARLNVGSAAVVMTSALNPEKVNKMVSNLPTLELSLQQQVSGPFCARLDTRFTLDSLSFKKAPQIEDLIYGFEWCPEFSGALKVVAWYSPTRNEGMMEFRLLDK